MKIFLSRSQVKLPVVELHNIVKLGSCLFIEIEPLRPSLHLLGHTPKKVIKVGDSRDQILLTRNLLPIDLVDHGVVDQVWQIHLWVEVVAEGDLEAAESPGRLVGTSCGPSEIVIKTNVLSKMNFENE